MTYKLFCASVFCLEKFQPYGTNMYTSCSIVTFGSIGVIMGLELYTTLGIKGIFISIAKKNLVNIF